MITESLSANRIRLVIKSPTIKFINKIVYRKRLEIALSAVSQFCVCLCGTRQSLSDYH